MHRMEKTFASATREVAKLPKETQAEFGRDLIDRVAAWHQLREKIAEGIRELDAGLGQPLDIKKFMKELRRRHARKK